MPNEETQTLDFTKPLISIETPEDLIPLSSSWLIDDELKPKIKNCIRKAISRKHSLSKKQEDQIKGDVGEMIVCYHIRKSMNQAGYKECNGCTPGTFILHSQYKTKKKKIKRVGRGVDHYLRFTNHSGEKKIALIETKNWSVTTCKKYFTSQRTFTRDVLDRFIQSDKFHKNTWMICCNKRGYEFAKERCDYHHIHYISLNEHYTRALIRRVAFKMEQEGLKLLTLEEREKEQQI